jgi:hypothetical protein
LHAGRLFASVRSVLGKAGILSCFSVSLVVGAMLVPAASAQTADDPVAGSPPRAVYQIPFESARSDAAPRKRSEETAPSAGGGNAGGGNDGSGGSSSGSVYRSENDFGSSSQVPGADDVLSTASVGTTSKTAAAIPDPLPTANEGETSVPTAVLLLALIAVTGVGVGTMAVRSARRRS